MFLTISARTGTCSHTFHFTVLKEWVKINNTCPLCKAKIRAITKVDYIAFHSIYLPLHCIASLSIWFLKFENASLCHILFQRMDDSKQLFQFEILKY